MSLTPLVRWTTFQGWTLRYTTRSNDSAAGTFTTPAAKIPFRYDRQARTIHLPERTVQLNEHGWEINAAGQTQFKSRKERTDGQP